MNLEVLGHLADKIGLPLSLQERLGISPLQGIFFGQLQSEVTKRAHRKPSTNCTFVGDAVVIDAAAENRDHSRLALIIQVQTNFLNNELRRHFADNSVPFVRVGSGEFGLPRNQTVPIELAQSTVALLSKDPSVIAGVIQIDENAVIPYRFDG